MSILPTGTTNWARQETLILDSFDELQNSCFYPSHSNASRSTIETSGFTPEIFALRIQRNESTTWEELLALGPQYSFDGSFILDLSENWVTDQQLQEINRRFPNIIEVKASCYHRDYTLSPLKNLQNLISLDLGFVCDNTLASLSDLPNLRNVTVFSAVISGWDLAASSHLLNLESLNLAGCTSVGDDFVVRLCNLYDKNERPYPTIQSLNSVLYFAISDIKEDDLRSSNNSLVSLDLSETKITNTGLFCLSYLPSLQNLNLTRCRYVDLFKDLRFLGLVTLDLSHCKIADSDLKYLFAQEDGFIQSSLETLNLKGCENITEAGIDYLKRELPNLRIIRD